MAYSHIKLTGGAGDGKTIRNTITQTNHGFTIGQAIRYNIASATGIPTDKYSPSEATGGVDKAEVVGIVDDIFGDNEFSLTYAGEINTAVFGDPFKLETGPDIFFLSAGLTAGQLTGTPPTSAGDVIKPVLVKTDGDRAVLTNYIGSVIGGESTVSLDQVQPVATIQPFAAPSTSLSGSSLIPKTWDLCDGRALSVTDYPELYTRIGRSFGFHMKITLDYRNWTDSVYNTTTESTIQRAIPVKGQRIKFGNGQIHTGIITEVGDNYLIFDVEYLFRDTLTPDTELKTDVYNVGGFGLHGIVQVGVDEFTTRIGAIEPLLEPDVTSPRPFYHDQHDYMSSDADALRDHYTAEVVKFRIPDLRGKVVLGESLTGQGTAIPADRNFNLGQFGGAYDVIPTNVTDGDWYGTASTDAVEADNLQPYIGMNWIMKVTPNTQAALLDNLTAQLPLVDLTDVNAEGLKAGSIIVYDTASAGGDKFKTLTLFDDGYPTTTAHKQSFQIQVKNTLPTISMGTLMEAKAGVQVVLDGLHEGNFRVFENTTKYNSNSPSFEIKGDSIGVGTGAQPYSTNPDGGANITIGPGGMKFTASGDSGGGSNRMSHFRSEDDGIRADGTATDGHLVSEAAVRAELDTQAATLRGEIPRLYELDIHGLPSVANFSSKPGGTPQTGANKADNGIETGTYRAQDFGVPDGATHIQIQLEAFFSTSNPVGNEVRVMHYCSGPTDDAAKRISLLQMRYQSNTGKDAASAQALVPIDTNGEFTLTGQTIATTKGNPTSLTAKPYGAAVVTQTADDETVTTVSGNSFKIFGYMK